MKKIALALILMVLGSLALWATEGTELKATRLPAAHALATAGEFSFVSLLNENGAVVGYLGPVPETSEIVARGDGIFEVSDLNGNPRIQMRVSRSGHGEVVVADPGGTITAAMSAEIGFWSRNGDLAEQFPSNGSEITPGSVVIVDSKNPGALTLSTRAYDRKVAGVVSGASDYDPAITLGKRDEVGHVPVTLTGTAYCLVTNSNGPIKAGDLLTTSDVPGHAMKVTDFESSQGAILGKAMQDFDQETGLVMILAALQ